MDVTFNERTKCASEFSPGWSEAEPWVTPPIRSKARFSGRPNHGTARGSERVIRDHGYPLATASRSAPTYPGLRCACPGPNFAAGDAGSLNRFFQSTRNLRLEFILGPTPEGGH